MVIVFINGIFIKTTIIIILLTTEKSYNVSVPMSVTKFINASGILMLLPVQALLSCLLAVPMSEIDS